ncbi:MULTISPECIES: hypothetical protein [Modicisalibacter]|uniref:hypothetical protein n=1 Tax=Modicisalibacter TaxID=574347 RepID=UPI00100AC8E5|nr:MULTISPECIES: hypothetical protein [Halomonadaceae]MBZ9558910.1 hypothetical protein [Modicisalibacter sp. R2A 31.J]MBZ9575198.1 hypothetical protein [Modicisalibacter sp. MOD 31.J]
MAKRVDTLRVLAIASQAVGFILILTLETVLGDAARPWQGVTLALMLAAALIIAVLRQYRRNRARKAAAEREMADD